MTISSRIVPASNAGILWQVDRALYHLACTCGPDGVIGIEADVDDIAGVLGDGTRFSEQDKLSFSKSGHPYQDRAEGLWNTLAIWLAAAADPGSKHHMAKLLLVTTRPVPPNSFARRLHSADNDRDVRNCIRLLRQLAKNPAGKMAKLMKEVTDYDDDVLAHVIRRIELHDLQPLSCDSEWKSKLLHHLAVPADIAGDNLLQALIGWLHETVLGLWKAHKPAWISRQALLNRKDQLTAKLATQKFLVRMRDEVIVDRARLHDERTRGRRLVRRIEEVELEEGDVMEAISNWLKYSDKALDLAQEGDVSDEDLEEFRSKLATRWKLKVREHHYQQKAAKKRSALPTEAERGQQIYFDTLHPDYRPVLQETLVDAIFFWHGAYHSLADDDRVGWHPEYEVGIDWRRKD